LFPTTRRRLTKTVTADYEDINESRKIVLSPATTKRAAAAMSKSKTKTH